MGHDVKRCSSSLSKMEISSESEVKFGAVAVIVKDCIPSVKLSSIIVKSNDAEVSPAKIVTVAGTTASEVSLYDKLTTRS